MTVGKEIIKDFKGFIIGWVETDSNGNKTVKDFKGFILGYYDKQADQTKDFRGFILGKGDFCISLIYKSMLPQ